jgi:hypothetical protein
VRLGLRAHLSPNPSTRALIIPLLRIGSST